MSTGRTVVAAALFGGGSLPPLEEYLSVESWLEALPAAATLRVTLDDGTAYLTSVRHILESSLLGAVVDRFRIQLRLGRL